MKRGNSVKKKISILNIASIDYKTHEATVNIYCMPCPQLNKKVCVGSRHWVKFDVKYIY